MGKSKRTREAKICDECSQSQTVLFRVKYASFEQWRMVCATCLVAVKAKPGYVYGGTWKQSKRN